ncbi:MAG TPA: NUMOD4 domain-containing protein [Streptosporangiaceae bacterium]|nr:NUMOD4 domain-containing protein [Streptosporangiaceae bacterium]
MKQPSEVWEPVPGWPGYEVSDGGGVRSVDRVLGDGRSCGGEVLAQRRGRKGYLRVTLRDGARSWTADVHVLVMLTFKGQCPDGKEIRHLGRQDDNRLVKLAYGTHSQNERDKRKRKRTGRNRRGKSKINNEAGSIASRVPLNIDPRPRRSQAVRP